MEHLRRIFNPLCGNSVDEVPQKITILDQSVIFFACNPLVTREIREDAGCRPYQG